jgi:hypothetical protein
MQRVSLHRQRHCLHHEVMWRNRILRSRRCRAQGWRYLGWRRRQWGIVRRYGPRSGSAESRATHLWSDFEQQHQWIERSQQWQHKWVQQRLFVRMQSFWGGHVFQLDQRQHGVSLQHREQQWLNAKTSATTAGSKQQQQHKRQYHERKQQHERKHHKRKQQHHRWHYPRRGLRLSQARWHERAGFFELLGRMQHLQLHPVRVELHGKGLRPRYVQAQRGSLQGRRIVPRGGRLQHLQLREQGRDGECSLHENCLSHARQVAAKAGGSKFRL